jgi:hypothetical protein
MIEFGVLLLVVLVLYFAECAVWVPAESIAFRLPLNPARPVRMITKLRAVPRPCIVFAYPFGARSEVIVCSPLPVFLSPEGIVANSRVKADMASSDFVAFEDMHRIEPELRKLLINGAEFVTAASEIQAKELADLLQRVRKRTSKERAIEIEKVIAHSLDSDCAYSRLGEFSEKTSDLRLDSLGLMAVIFVVSPILVWKWGLLAIWPFLLSFMVVNTALIAWDFHRANRDLFPASGTARWSSIIMILLSPPAALRAAKYLARDIGDGYHPLALAASRCSNEEIRALASWVLREVTFEPDTVTRLDKPAAECTQWFRRKIRDAILALVYKHGDDPEELIAPPKRESEHVRSYCPRCLSQFVISDGVCTDCDGISLRPFDLL